MEFLPEMREAQRRWAFLSVCERLDWLPRFRHLVCCQRSQWVSELAELRLVDEFEALVSEVLPLLDGARWLEQCAARTLAPRKSSLRFTPGWMMGHRLEVQRRPWGVVMILAPANYPLFLAGIQSLQALVAGNAVVLKPAVGREAPAVRLQRALEQSGLPKGLMQVVPSRLSVVSELLEAGVDFAVLTGSEQTGQSVLPRCAQKLVPTVAELSGRDVVVVAPDGDLPLALTAVSWGQTLNRGQTCMAPQRLWLPEGRLSELPQLAMEVRGYQHPEELRGWLESEAWGLGVSLFAGEEWKRTILPWCRSGFVTVNDIIAPTADPSAPFGGRGRSGYGVTRGAEGLLALTYPQSIFHNRGPRFHLMPPSGREHAFMDAYAAVRHGRGLERARAVGKLAWAWIRLVLRQAMDGRKKKHSL